MKFELEDKLKERLSGYSFPLPVIDYALNNTPSNDYAEVITLSKYGCKFVIHKNDATGAKIYETIFNGENKVERLFDKRGNLYLESLPSGVIKEYQNGVLKRKNKYYDNKGNLTFDYTNNTNWNRFYYSNDGELLLEVNSKNGKISHKSYCDELDFSMDFDGGKLFIYTPSEKNGEKLVNCYDESNKLLSEQALEEHLGWETFKR